ncbi:hypothetical protein [Lysobacter humi (ex Lee et al. 2017)]
MTRTPTNEPGSTGHGFNLSGGGLVGHKDAGLDSAREAAAREAAATQAQRDAARDGADTSVAGGPGTSTGPGISRVGSGTTGLNNYSPGSDLSAGARLAGESGGERASAGINDADRASRDRGNDLGG